MLKSISLLGDIKKKISIVYSSNKNKRAFEKYLAAKYDFLSVNYMQYVLGVRKFSDMKDEELFWIVDSLNSFKEFEKIPVEKYFSDLEIRKFSSSKYIYKTKEKYPIVIENILQVADDQWISVVDVNFLKDLYDKQLIIYNPNTQRELKKHIRQGGIYYTININNKSVNEIKGLLKSGQFIPNDLSFNLSLDNPKVNYDIRKNEFVILGGQLDIIDGFHRFKAAMELKGEDKDFNYNFIMKIMNYTEVKANTYIAQEDKRNKISSQYSKALDNTNQTSVIVDKLNTESDSLLKGLIGKEGLSPVNRTYVFNAIDCIYDTGKMTRAELLKTGQHLVEVFNDCLDNDPNLQLDIYEIALIIYASKIYPTEKNIYHLIESKIKNKNLVPKSSTVTKKYISYIEAIF